MIILFIEYAAASDFNERVSCSIKAAIEYNIPADILLSIAEIENGKPGEAILNSNGTVDIGVMQFNSTYLKDLAKYGITDKHVAVSGCYPYRLAAWRIRQHLLHDKGSIWQRSANYHSYTRTYNEHYQERIKERSPKWISWLTERYPIKEWNPSDEIYDGEIPILSLK